MTDEVNVEAAVETAAEQEAPKPSTPLAGRVVVLQTVDGVHVQIPLITMSVLEARHAAAMLVAELDKAINTPAQTAKPAEPDSAEEDAPPPPRLAD
jgi:hypothetical protein